MFKIGDLVERVRNEEQTRQLRDQRGYVKPAKVRPKFGVPYRVEAVLSARGILGLLLVGIRSEHRTGGFAAGYFRKIERADDAFIRSIRQKADA